MNNYHKKAVNISHSGHFDKLEKNAQIRVICGPMFSGKTKRLICCISEYESNNKSVLVFKPQIDNRYGADEIVSHDKDALPAIAVSEPKQILDYSMKADVIAIDEVQFFDDSIVKVCKTIADHGKTCIVSGLDLDFKAAPFGAMPNLLAIADEIIKLNAICVFCSDQARYTHRLSKENETVVLGEKNKYAPLCRSCYHEQTF